MDPLSALLFSAAITWWIKHFGENGHAEYAHALDRHAKEVAKAHPDWSQRRVQRHARRQTRGYWWDQAQQGFPDFWEARDADRDTIAARREEAKLSTAKRRRDAWQRIRDAKAEWERLHDEDRAREAGDAEPDAPSRPAPDASEADPEVIDAEIVDDGTPTPEPSAPAEDTRPAAGPEPAAAPPADPAPTRPGQTAPGLPRIAAPGVPHGPGDDAARPAREGTTKPAVAGERQDPMAPRSPGHVVPRNGTAPATRTGAAMVNGGVGESWTHGQFEHGSTTIRAHLDDLPAILEKMLRDLNSVDAGRDQVAGVMRIYRDEVLFMEQLEQMLAESNKRARPVVAKVEAAGGPEQIPQMSYFSQV